MTQYKIVITNLDPMPRDIFWAKDWDSLIALVFMLEKNEHVEYYMVFEDEAGIYRCAQTNGVKHYVKWV